MTTTKGISISGIDVRDRLRALRRPEVVEQLANP